MHKVVIVGSGPAGLSAAAHAAKLGMGHVLLEKTRELSDTIRKYQKGKHVMATPSQLILRADIEFDAGTREAILGSWEESAKGVNVQYDAEVTAVSGGKGNFTIKLANGGTVQGETVILAIGTQGNPNLVRCPVDEAARVQYTLDDPAAYVDEHIFVIGAGDAGIENALGLVADPAQRNTVTVINRSSEFATAKKANVQLLSDAERDGRLSVMRNSAPTAIENNRIRIETRNGERRRRCDRVIARIGAAPPRKFVEGCGVKFTSADRQAFPQLTPTYESTVPGLFVVGALAGYPLIKNCINQGYDVIELINGNHDLKPADQPLLEAQLAQLPPGTSVDDWLEYFRRSIGILNELSPLQMRELMLEADARIYREGELIFEKDAPGQSLFAVAGGVLSVEVGEGRTVPIPQGSIVGEVGLISGRPRGATVRAAKESLLLEIPRLAALQLMASVPAAARAITRISVERQLLQVFGSGLTPNDLADIIDTAEVKTLKAGELLLEEGAAGKDVFVVRSGSMVVERRLAGKQIFLSYLPAGTYVGESGVLDGSARNATVRAAIRSDVIQLDGELFGRLLSRRPKLFERASEDAGARRDLSTLVAARSESFKGVVERQSSVANFLVANGIGEATDVLLIDEKLCVGCDNCEKACADAHDGLSRLDREAGRTLAHLHVPTSCRHCEHPHCMADCPPDAISRGLGGEVKIDRDTCIGCGNCQRNCPYGVIRMEALPPRKPSLLSWLFFGGGPGPGEASYYWRSHQDKSGEKPVKKAVKCDMCVGTGAGPACVSACPTGAAIRVAPEEFLSMARLHGDAE